MGPLPMGATTTAKKVETGHQVWHAPEADAQGATLKRNAHWCPIDVLPANSAPHQHVGCHEPPGSFWGHAMPVCPIALQDSTMRGRLTQPQELKPVEQAPVAGKE
jgi:hypothetical protein